MNTRLVFTTIAFLNFSLSLLLIMYSLDRLQLIRKNKSLIKKNLVGYEHFDELYPLKRFANYSKNFNHLPYIYIITPTYKSESQLPDLIRLRNTLVLVPKLVWIVIEDSPFKTERVVKFLNESNIDYIHLNVSSPKVKPQPGLVLHKGVVQRNHALAMFRSNKNFFLKKKGVVYFADDDNTYDRRLFDEMRFTKKVSVWPVGTVGGVMYEKPICKDTKVIDWFCTYNRQRKFPIDMAGFSVNLELIIEKETASFTLLSHNYLESAFVEQLVTKNELEAKANECTKVYTWHTKTNRKNYDYKLENSSIYNEFIKNQII